MLTIPAVQGQETSNIGLAIVDQRLGYEIYCLADPIQAYEEVCAVNVSSFAVSIPDKDDKVNVKAIPQKRTITDKISHFATLIKEEDEAGIVDAILYSGGQVAKGIRFTGNTDSNKKRLARVWNESGIDLYVLSEPLIEEENLSKKKKWSYDGLRKGGGGLFNKKLDFIKETSTLETDIYGMLRLIAKGNPNKWPDGLIINASGFIQGFNYKKEATRSKTIFNPN